MNVQFLVLIGRLAEKAKMQTFQSPGCRSGSRCALSSLPALNTLAPNQDLSIIKADRYKEQALSLFHVDLRRSIID